MISEFLVNVSGSFSENVGFFEYVNFDKYSNYFRLSAFEFNNASNSFLYSTRKPGLEILEAIITSRWALYVPSGWFSIVIAPRFETALHFRSSEE